MARFYEVFCFIVFFLVVVLLSGCEIEELARGKKDVPEIGRERVSLDKIEELDLEEYEKYFRYRVPERVSSEEYMNYMEMHYRVHLWALNKRFKEESRE